MTQQTIPLEFVIKDFTRPAPNGNMYDLSDPATIKAIEKFCAKPEHMAELGNPRFTHFQDHNAKLARVSSIQMDNAVAVISQPQFNKEKGTITGLVKPFGGLMPDLLDQLQSNKVTFGMRAFVQPNVDLAKGHAIHGIVTFDVVNPG